MISEGSFWKGRDKTYAGELTADIRNNGAITLGRVNIVLAAFHKDTGVLLTRCSSGWRPRVINAKTSNAGKTSNHIEAKAEDVTDTPHRDFARWLCANQALLERLGLWCERFEWTPTWVHFQTVPPGSGLRFYVPTVAPARCERLPEQDRFSC